MPTPSTPAVLTYKPADQGSEQRCQLLLYLSRRPAGVGLQQLCNDTGLAPQLCQQLLRLLELAGRVRREGPADLPHWFVPAARDALRRQARQPVALS